MGFLDFLFSEKDNKTKQQIEIEENLNEASNKLVEGSILCEYCKREIFKEETRKKIKYSGKTYSLCKKCFRKIKKKAFSN